MEGIAKLEESDDDEVPEEETKDPRASFVP